MAWARAADIVGRLRKRLKCNLVLAKQKFFSLLCRHIIPNLNPSLILFIKSL